MFGLPILLVLFLTVTGLIGTVLVMCAGFPARRAQGGHVGFCRPHLERMGRAA